ncbi:sensor histidine kinase [Paenibacillus sp. JTLBN-2024]
MKLRNPLTKMNVKQQMILLFLVLVIPLFILNSYGNGKAGQVLKRHVTNAYIELNKQNFKLISRDIETINKVTSTVLQNAMIQQLSTAGDETILTRVKNYEKIEVMLNTYSQETDEREPLYYSLYVYDPDNAYFSPLLPGIEKVGAVFLFEREGKAGMVRRSRLPQRERLFEADGSSFASVKGQKDQQTLLYVRAINNIYKGGTIGVLAVSNVDARIGESLKTVSLPEGEIYFTDWNNHILTTTEQGRTGVLDLPPELDPGNSAIGVKDVITKDFIYVADYNYALQQKLIYKVPVKALLQQQNEIKRVILVISIAYFIVGLIIILYFWRSLMTPLQKLVFFVRRYEPGQIVPQTPLRKRNDEVSVLISTIYDMARRLNDLIHYQYAMDLKQKEFQLSLLYQQINPHLLYNTLESIYWKSMMEGNTTSAEMIKDLSKLMKISLSRGRELITLEEELEHATAYIKLQQNRYDYAFRVEMDVPEHLYSVHIPKITLQPLIENAIIHGIKNMGEDGEIRIAAEERRGVLYIRISDNGFKPVDYETIRKVLGDDSPNPAKGYGIRNIHQRLQLHFGPEYGLAYEAREGGGTTVTVSLQITRQED